MIPTSLEKGVATYELDSWWHFVELMRDPQHMNQSTFVYRGQAESNWRVDSTLDRLERRFPSERNYSGGIPDSFNCSPASRDDHYCAFREAIRGKVAIESGAWDELDWWCCAPHHGLPTPMLDWTYSPFVALYFAFEPECVQHEADWKVPEKRAVFALRTHFLTLTLDPNDGVPFMYSPQDHVSARLNSQAGVFVCLSPKTDLELYVRAHHAELSGGGTELPEFLTVHQFAILEKILIPGKDRRECLKYLHKMNIHRMSLFPDIDGAARHVQDQWELDFDTILGRFTREGRRRERERNAKLKSMFESILKKRDSEKH